jgi:hypothetical protein
VRSHEALRKAKEFVTAQGGEIAPLSISEEELNPEMQDDLSVQAYPLESTYHTYPVPFTLPADGACSEFRFFEDGRQRTIQIGYIRAEYASNLVLIPVHFFVVAAVILERVEKRLTLWNEPVVEQGIFVARSLVPDQSILTAFEQDGYLIVDTDGKDIGHGGDYYDMRRRALRRAKEHRLKAEQDLITRWRKAKEAMDSFLIVDGTLMNMRDENNVDRCVGVSKSFGSRYFDVSTHNRILQMSEFDRSWTFRFHAPEDDQRKGVRERVSWYVRLRAKHNPEPEFGLVRIEISKQYSDDASAMADKISKSLLSERLPTAYPAPRWDKHLYPIRECENYLNSVMPSISTITASMCG